MQEDLQTRLMRVARYADLLGREGLVDSSGPLGAIVGTLEAFMEGEELAEQDLLLALDALAATPSHPGQWQASALEVGVVRRARALPTPPQVAFVLRKAKPVSGEAS